MVVRYIRKGPVNYDVVGTPTISNEVASNFSLSDYTRVSTANFPSTITSFEVGIEFTTGSDISNQNICGMYNARGGFYIADSKLYATPIDFSINKRRNYVTALTLNTNTTYWAKWRWDSEGFKVFWSLDGIYWEKEVPDAAASSVDIDSYYNFGATNANAFLGSIDLKDTYIKINDELYFGKEIFIPKVQIDEATQSMLSADSKVLLRGEPAYEVDTNSLKIGDGVTTYKDLPYLVDNTGEWVKPDDWIDIRSGALPNCIYMLVGHSADYSVCPYFAFNITLSDTTHNYKVYIDNNLQGTYASGADVKLSWEELALTTGFNTTFPENLRVHIVRFETETSADTFNIYQAIRYASSGTEQQGVLWVHFTVEAIGSFRLCAYSTSISNRKLVAITAVDDKLHLTSQYQNGFIGNTQDKYVQRSSYLAKLPTIEVDTLVGAGGMFNYKGPLKKAKLIVNDEISFSGTGTSQCTSFCSGSIEELEINKPIKLGASTNTAMSLFRDSSIRALPVIDYSNVARMNVFLTANTKLRNTILDLSKATKLKQVYIQSTADAFQKGLVGLFVSPEAPFDYTDGFAIRAGYNGLDRQALVNLFKSMPYNNSITLTGAATITDGVLGNLNSSSSANLQLAIPSGYKKIEMVLKVNYGDTAFGSASYIPVCGFGTGPGSQRKITLSGASGSGLGFTFSSDVPNASMLYSSDFNFASAINNNGFVYVKFVVEKVVNGYDYTVSASTDATSWTDGNTYNYETEVLSSKYIYLLRNGSGAASGKPTMFLNDSSIKIDGVEWGQLSTPTAMTKTCSIVGCTGTDDLTAEDKAIAEDKGWELVLVDS